MLTQEETAAMEVLKSYGWQMVSCAHVSDWDDGDDEKVTADVVLMKVDL